MNKVHQVVWNAARRVWMAVSEKARGNGNLLSYVLGCAALFAAVAAGAPSASALGPGALPTGGQIVSGSGSISQSGNRMKINQQSQKMIADWMTFNIGSAAGVTFVQPNSSSAALNLISDQNPSQILGSLTANGKVFLLNPNGIIFGSTARIDVGGLVASSLSLSNADFLAGRYNFVNSGGAGAIVNQGSITAAPHGVVALIAPQVTNQGTITASQGSVALAAGDRVSLDFVGDGLIKLSVDAATLNAAVANSGALIADGGVVTMTAQTASSLLTTVVNNTGLIEADSLGSENGVVVLNGGAQGIVANSGTIRAIGANSGETGGTVTITGYDVGLRAGSAIDVSGASGGGQVYVGGGFHGANQDISNANAVVMVPGASIIADATQKGNGGKVVLWSEKYTNFAGSISAQGGPLGGNGGYVETSSKKVLDASGTVNTLAPLGKAGTWLLDPGNVTITSGGYAPVWTPIQYTYAPLSSGSITNGTILGGLEHGNVIIDATGNIVFVASIVTTGDLGASRTLTLEAGYNINMGILGFYRIDATKGGNTEKLNIDLESNVSGFGGVIYMGFESGIFSNGGYIKMGTGAHVATGVSAGTYGNGITLNGATLNSQVYNSVSHTFSNSGAGAITLKGQGYSSLFNSGYAGVAIEGGSTIKGGAITITGTGGSGGESSGSGGAGVSLGGGSGITGSGAVIVAGYGGTETGLLGHGGAGVYLGDVSGITGSGSVTINGTGGNEAVSGSGGMGVAIEGGSAINGGAVSITGDGGNGTGPTGVGGVGVYLGGGSAITGSGAVIVAGYGGTGTLETGGGAGVSFSGGTSGSPNTISGAGVTITGTGGAGSGPYSSGMAGNGIYAGNGHTTITSSSGKLKFYGYGGPGNPISTAGTALGSNAGNGINVQNSGNLTLDSTGGTGIIVKAYGGGGGNATVTGAGLYTARGGNGGLGIYVGDSSRLTIETGASSTGITVKAKGGAGGNAYINNIGGSGNADGGSGLYGIGVFGTTSSLTITDGSSVGTGVSVTAHGGDGRYAKNTGSGEAAGYKGGAGIYVGGTLHIASTNGGIGVYGYGGAGGYAKATGGGAATNYFGPGGRGIGFGDHSTTTIAAGGGLTIAGTGGNGASSGVGDSGGQGVVFEGASVYLGPVRSMTWQGGIGYGAGHYGGVGAFFTGTNIITYSGVSSITGTGGGGKSGANGGPGVVFYKADTYSGGGNGAFAIRGQGGCATGSGSGGAGILFAYTNKIEYAAGPGGAVSMTGTGGSGARGGAGVGFIGAYNTAFQGTTVTINGRGVSNSPGVYLGGGASITGITGTGPLLIEAEGDIVIGSGCTIATTSAGVSNNVGVGGALALVAQGGVFINNEGPDAISVTGGGNWLVYSATPVGGDRGGLVYDFIQYDAIYGSTTVTGEGDGFLYAPPPSICSVGTTWNACATNETFIPGFDPSQLNPWNSNGTNDNFRFNNNFQRSNSPPGTFPPGGGTMTMTVSTPDGTAPSASVSVTASGGVLTINTGGAATQNPTDTTVPVYTSSGGGIHLSEDLNVIDTGSALSVIPSGGAGGRLTSVPQAAAGSTVTVTVRSPSGGIEEFTIGMGEGGVLLVGSPNGSSLGGRRETSLVALALAAVKQQMGIDSSGITAVVMMTAGAT